jgi:hypothetical protein
MQIDNLNKLPFDKLKKPNILSSDISIRKSLLDDKGMSIKPYQFLHDISTNMILKYFLSDGEYTTMKFIIPFLDIIDKKINEYIDEYYNYYWFDILKYKRIDIIRFILKGGNIFRLLFIKISNQLNIINNINIFLQNTNQRTDFDYMVIINRTKINNDEYFNKIYNDISILLYNCLDELRNILYENRHKYFNYYQNTLFQESVKDIFKKNINIEKDNFFKNTDIIDDIKKINENIKNTKCINIIIDNKTKDIDNKTKDEIINIIEKQKNISKANTEIIKENEIPLFINIIKNIYINMTTESEIYKNIYISMYRTTFTLLRLKYNFILEFTKDKQTENINSHGELIDISILYDGDIYFDDKYTTYYEFVYPTYDIINKFFKEITRINILSVSPYYLFTDLDVILFKQPPYPWADKKYIKRLDRYFLLILYFIITDKNKIDKINIIMKLKSIKIKIENIKTLKENLKDEWYKDISNFTSNLYHYKNDIFYNMIFFLTRYIRKNKSQSNDRLLFDHNDPFIIFINHLLKYLNFIILLIEKNQDISNINIDFNNNVVIGGYHKKYIKYKKKYLELKNFK